MITSAQIKEYALAIGFDACGICKAEAADADEQKRFRQWIAASYHADMGYMAQHEEKRLNPSLLVEGGRSVVCVALNYYPEEKQPEEYPQFAYYAYGKDYHDVVRRKLQQLYAYIQSIDSSVSGRAFVDTAPVMERYWAAQAGLGFVGKNSLLIIPKKGSYFFLGELILDTELDYDAPLDLSCGNCTRCIDACPTRAIVAPKMVDAKRCISYQTIENKGEIEESVALQMKDRFYGCDICQQVCPWNRYARPHNTEDFKPSPSFLDLSFDRLDSLTEEEYRHIFKGSAVKRAKYVGLKRNLDAIKQSQK